MSHWKRKRVFVTGATGLLGGWLVQALLDEGAEVTALVRDHVPASMFIEDAMHQRCKLVYGDVRSVAEVAEHLFECRAQVVFHLAAQTLVETALESPASTFEVNIGGTIVVCEAVRRAKRWVEACVIASSDKAYGDHGGEPYEESMELRATLPYDASKAASEYVARSYALTYDLPIAITRCGNFFGGGDLNYSRLVPGTIRSIYDGQAPVIRSNGEAVRDYIYVKDGALAYMWLAQGLVDGAETTSGHARSLGGEAFNFGYQTPWKVRDLVHLIRERMATIGFEVLAPVFENRVGNTELDRQTLSTDRAIALGWRPKYTLARALDETCAWYIQRLKDADLRDQLRHTIEDLRDQVKAEAAEARDR